MATEVGGFGFGLGFAGGAGAGGGGWVASCVVTTGGSVFASSIVPAGGRSGVVTLTDVVGDGVADGVGDGVGDRLGVGEGETTLGDGLGVGRGDGVIAPGTAGCLSLRASALATMSSPMPAPTNASPTTAVTRAWARLPVLDPVRIANMMIPTIATGMPTRSAANHGPTTTPQATA